MPPAELAEIPWGAVCSIHHTTLMGLCRPSHALLLSWRISISMDKER